MSSAAAAGPNRSVSTWCYRVNGTLSPSTSSEPEAPTWPVIRREDRLRQLSKTSLEISAYGSPKLHKALSEPFGPWPIGARRPLKEGAAAKLVGHTWKKWTAAGCPGAVLALVHTTRLMSPKETKLKLPNKADTGAYSWKSAPCAPSVAAAGAKGAPRLFKRNRFGDGKEYRSGPNTRLQPPVLRSTRLWSSAALFRTRRAGRRQSSPQEVGLVICL